jgi:predicted ATPase
MFHRAYSCRRARSPQLVLHRRLAGAALAVSDRDGAGSKTRRRHRARGIELAERCKHAGVNDMRGRKIVIYRRGELWIDQRASALRHLEQAVEMYQPVEHRKYTFEFAQDIGVRAFCYLSLALWHRGNPDQASKAAGKALRYAKESTHAHTLAYALFFGAMTAIFQRCVTEVEERANASIALAKEHGFALWLGRGQVLRGWVMAQHGGGAAAVESINEGMSATAATGSALWQPFLSALLAEALGLAGKTDEGLMILTQGLAAAAASGQIGTDAELHRLRGHLLRNLPNPDWTASETCFQNAIAIARQQGTRGFELRATLSLSRLLAEQGFRGEAPDMLASVYGEFGEGFEMPDLKDAKMLLDALSSSSP